MTAIAQTPSSAKTPSQARSEKEIGAYFIKIIQNDCTVSFSKLFQKKYNPLCLYAQRIVGAHELAEEVVSDVFMKLWRNRQALEINYSYKAYLYRAVRNQAYDYLKSRSNTNSQLTDAIEDCTAAYALSTDSIEDNYYAKELQYKIETAIEQLPRQCKIIFRMSREEQLKYHEIADRMGLSVKTIETQIGRALKHLRLVLL
jgi:RNA polymerase sigma-70 factor, ECF subfamily